jgi:hypothetical protein
MRKQGVTNVERKPGFTHHSVVPQNIDDHNWYYEKKNGIELIHQVTSDADEYQKTDSVFIPWEKLAHSIRRHYGTYN